MDFTEVLPVPRLDGEYRAIYRPQPDIYLGPNTPSFQNGVTYPDWITNDFTLLKGNDGAWHAIGITHPQPPGFVSAFTFDLNTVHEAESQLFHAVYAGRLSELHAGAEMEQKAIVMRPATRPGEPADCWAPAVFPVVEGYRMLYSPESMRTAVSADLYRWEPQGTLFASPRGNLWMRDPYVYEEDGIYYIIYNDADDNGVDAIWLRRTTDFKTISDPEPMMPHCFHSHAAMESPCFFKRDGWYYLLWSIYDGQNGCYDNRTFVFASRTIDDFKDKAPVAMLPGHAVEVVCEDGEWYIASVFYPHNGVSLAKLKWEPLF